MEKNNFSFLPQALIAGFPRCGTTSLVRILDSYEEFYCIGKQSPESKLILNWTGDFRAIGEKYSDFFKKTNYYRIEKSTSYSENPFTYHLWKRINPEMKWIFILRDPIERLISNYNWSIKNGLESRNLHDAIIDSLDGLKIQSLPRPHDYIWRSLYGMHLNSWLKYNDMRFIHLIRFEDFQKDMIKEMSRLSKFLLGKSLEAPYFSETKINSSFGKESSISLCQQVKEKLFDTFSKDSELILENFKNFDISDWMLEAP